MKCVGDDMQNTDFKRYSGKVKVCNQHGCPCTACLDNLNCVILQHNEGMERRSGQKKLVQASIIVASHQSAMCQPSISGLIRQSAIYQPSISDLPTINQWFCTVISIVLIVGQLSHAISNHMYRSAVTCVDQQSINH